MHAWPTHPTHATTLFIPTALSMAATPGGAAPCIGILALQGAFEEHRKIVEALGARTIEVSNVHMHAFMGNARAATTLLTLCRRRHPPL